MKKLSLSNKSKKLISDIKAVFGLTSVQQFFAIVLGVALLAYVIVVIMGVLSTSGILVDLQTSTYNETGWLNSSGYTLTNANVIGFNNPTIITISNTSTILVSGNWTLSGAILKNASAVSYPAVNISYSYLYWSNSERNSNNILVNTSTGVTGFFASINPVYAILAILVIILVLVVLVRVVTGSTQGSGYGRAETPL